MALTADSMKVLHVLYRRGSITDAEQGRMSLRCGPDTFAYLEGQGFLLRSDPADPGSPWLLNPILNNFITNLEGNVDSFPPQDFLFEFPVNDRYPSPPEIFIAMPYGPKWFAPVRDAIQRAAAAEGFAPQIGNNIEAPGFIMHQVWTKIRRAAAIVADLTELNPNVMYEIGMAHAVGKPVVFLLQFGTKAPFDIAANRLFYYSEDRIDLLEAALGAILRGLPVNPLQTVAEFET